MPDNLKVALSKKACAVLYKATAIRHKKKREMSMTHEAGDCLFKTFGADEEYLQLIGLTDIDNKKSIGEKTLLLLAKISVKKVPIMLVFSKPIDRASYLLMVINFQTAPLCESNELRREFGNNRRSFVQLGKYRGEFFVVVYNNEEVFAVIPLEDLVVSRVKNPEAPLPCGDDTVKRAFSMKLEENRLASEERKRRKREGSNK